MNDTTNTSSTKPPLPGALRPLPGGKGGRIRPVLGVGYMPDAKANHASLAEALDAVLDYNQHFVSYKSEHEAIAVTLWVAHTWAFEHFDFTPYLHIFSAEKRCGKTLVAHINRWIARVPIGSESLTGPALFRTIERYGPALILDEIDQLFRRKGEDTADIVAVLNSGFQRNGQITRLVGPKHETTQFSTFCPKILLGIANTSVPDTIRDRSIPIEMVRRNTNQTRNRFRMAREEEAQLDLAASLRYWTEQVEWDAINSALPDELDDRAQDIWEPLLAVADAAGGEWPERARQAAIVLSTGKDLDEESIGIRLLSDIRDIFIERGVDRIFSEDLVHALHAIEEAPWADWDYTKRKVSMRVKPYGVGSDQLRIGTENRKGYLRTEFEPVWATYLPPQDLPEPVQQTLLAEVTA